MAVTWPAFLQDELNTAGFSYNTQDILLKSSMDVGPAKVRARSTKRVDSLACTITIKISDFTSWNNFYTVTLANGTNQFSFPHPFTKVDTNFRFAKSPRIDPLGGEYLSISMEWEIMP